MRSLEALNADIDITERSLYDRDLQLSRHLDVLKAAWREQAKPIALIGAGVLGAGLFWRWRQRHADQAQARLHAHATKEEVRAAAAPSRWAQLAALAIPLLLHRFLPGMVPAKWRPLFMGPWLGVLWRWGRGTPLPGRRR